MPFFSAFTGSFSYGRRASAFRRVWNPSIDITAAAWLDASDTSSYTLNGFSDVTAVSDKRGNATVTVNGTPKLSGTLNGIQIWRFESGEDFTTDEFAQVDAEGNHWAIGVMKWQGRDDAQDSFWSTENNTVAGTSKRDYAISAGNVNPATIFNGELDLDGLSSNRISSTIGNLQVFDSGIAQNTWVIICAIFNKTGNQIAVRVNGTDAFTPVNDYTNALNTNMDLRIFRNRANERMGGSLAEFFSVADVPGTGDTDISTVEAAEGYLAWKWGLTASLPVDHPYKTKGPATIANYNPGGGGGASWYGDRAVVNNGIVNSSYSTTIEYFDITTLGNASSFGTSTVSGAHWGSVSDTTYAVSARGLNQSTIEYVTIATTGNATSFGTMLATSFRRAGASDGSRGLFASQGVDIEYITIATPSNATDFGDLNFTNGSNAGGSDGTYALWGGTNSNGNNIDYVTIQTTGNATDFGDLTTGRSAGAAASDDTRTIFTGGVDGITNPPTVDYVTTATPGNATDFGDLLALQYNHAATGNSTRAVVMGGENGGSNVIQYMTYQTPGNAIDFGDLAGNTSASGATSGSAGGGGGGASFTWGGDRGIMIGGNGQLDIDYWSIATPGNASLFGVISSSSQGYSFGSSCGDGTKVCNAATGTPSSPVNTILYVTASSTGNASDFGDLTQARLQAGSLGDGTYGYWMGGTTNYSNGSSSAVKVIDYVTLATTGNASIFGDLSEARMDTQSTGTNGSIGLIAGGQIPGTTYTNTIQSFTTGTSGNASAFGDLTATKRGGCGTSDTTRFCNMGGLGDGTGTSNVIDYVTMASSGNATDFGDLNRAASVGGACSDGTYATQAGGNPTAARAEIQYFTIQTLGNASDFGDLQDNHYNADCWSGSSS